jgi:hypothetical protein
MFSSMRTCELSPEGLAWYKRYLSALASGRREQLAPFFDETGAYQFNNHLPLYGGETIALGVSQYLGGVESLTLEVLNIYGTDHHFAVELLHHYVRKDGGQVTVPAAGFVERNAQGLIVQARAHVDATPVFDPGAIAR